MIEDKELDNILSNRQSQTQITFDDVKTDEKQSSSQTLTLPQTSETPSELIQQGVDAAIIHKLKTDKNVKKKFLDTADTVIDDNLTAIDNESEQKTKEAIVKNNKDACDLYGIEETTVPKWVVIGAKRVQDFLYAIWLIVGLFTTAPIVFLGKKIKVVFKHTWLASLLAIIIYILAVTSPLWLKLLNH